MNNCGEGDFKTAVDNFLKDRVSSETIKKRELIEWLKKLIIFDDRDINSNFLHTEELIVYKKGKKSRTQSIISFIEEGWFNAVENEVASD